MTSLVEKSTTPAARKREACAPHVPHPERTGGRRVLVVDDDSSIRESLRKVLQTEGYEVALAGNGREAIDKFNQERIDLVLLDLNLPVNSGWDTFGTLTAIDPLLPIIIITGRQNQSRLAAAAGISALMEKPLNVPLLLQTIAGLLAEEPMTRLKRLVGLHNDMQYAPPFQPDSPDTRSAGPSKLRTRIPSPARQRPRAR